MMGMGLAACTLLGGCAGFEESGLPGSAASMARNQIMWVEESPPSFGYKRMMKQTRAYPDLAAFVADKGIPDFLAETVNQGHDYFILYYLEGREAYACRTRAGSGRRLEFSGPYPVTDREFQSLDEVRSKNRG